MLIWSLCLLVITFVARATKSKPNVFDTKGNGLETLRLHSITFNLLSLAMSCILKGPQIFNASAILQVISSIFDKVVSFKSRGAQMAHFQLRNIQKMTAVCLHCTVGKISKFRRIRKFFETFRPEKFQFLQSESHENLFL